jgi:hypothetical protein
MYYGIPILKGLLVIIFTYLLRLDNQNSNGYLTFEILFLNMYLLCRPVASGGAGGHVPPQFLAEQLTLSQPGGQIMPTTVLSALPDFQTLRRPCSMYK